MNKKLILNLSFLMILCSCGQTSTSTINPTDQNSTNTSMMESLPDLSEKYEFKPYDQAFLSSTIVDEKAYDDDNIPAPVIKGELGEKTGKLNFFQINDTHGALETTKDISGMERVSTLKKNLESQNGDYISILGGDIFQGGYLSNTTYGKAFVDVLNHMDFDCFVIGNHEFDWGLDKIALYKDGKEENGELDAPFLGANIYYKDGTHPSWIDPYTIVNSNGYKVGIIGVIGESQGGSISADKMSNFVFKNTFSNVEKYSKVLRDEMDCDVVCVATHNYDDGENQRYARLQDGGQIDAIFCAHTHQKIEEFLPGITNSVPVIQSNTKNYTCGEVNMTIDGATINSTMKHHYVNRLEKDPEISKILENYQDIIDEGNKTVVTLNESLDTTKIGKIETKQMVESYSTGFSVINKSGIRGTIPAGEVKNNKLLEIFPFDNRLLIVKMKKLSAISYFYKTSNLTYTQSEDLLESAGEYIYITIIDFVYISKYNSSYFSNTTFYDTGDNIRDNFKECLINNYK